MWFLFSLVIPVREATYIADEANSQEKSGALRSPRRRTFASGRMIESLEVRRRLVAERRVDPAGVVEALDEAEDLTPRVRGRRKAASVEEFALQGREEALSHRVVVGVAHRAHRLHDAPPRGSASRRPARCTG